MQGGNSAKFMGRPKGKNSPYYTFQMIKEDDEGQMMDEEEEDHPNHADQGNQ